MAEKQEYEFLNKSVVAFEHAVFYQGSAMLRFE
jgi:hypothetical protein